MNFNLKSIFFTLILSTLSISVLGQVNFVRTDLFKVLKINGDTLENPWAGGFNSVQFSEIDLNLDGIKDLFVFDRAGNRISTFINGGEPGKVDYKHEPSYIPHFPNDFVNWVLLRDYNCDGKNDILAYYSGKVKAYQNTSISQLSFTEEDTVILSNYNPDSIPTGTPLAPLFISPTDIPAIDDIDGDGDLDVLTFSITGSYVEYHKNLSIENNGNCDSLQFELSNQCWGFFHENSSNNSVTINDTCNWNISNPQKLSGGNKHTGSTLFTLDVDDNNTKDLVLGDVSFNNFTMLTNSDTSSLLNKSSISAQDTTFPQNNNSTTATDIDVFPAGFYLDVNNDSIKDLIAAPNCNDNCKNNNNVWLYKNSGTTSNPNFNLTTESFLQEGMIDVGKGAHPVFFDYNSDGLMDIVVGNYGEYNSSLNLLYTSSLWLYENIGTSITPAFKLVTTDYANISTMNLDIAGNRPTLGLHPTFNDIDGDNDLDMILGDYNGHIHYFTNTAGAGNPASFVLTAPDYLNIDVGNNATPLLYDIDEDNLLDLIIGKQNGTFSYYHNTGTATSPNFMLFTDSLGKVVTKRKFGFNGNSNPIIVDSSGTTIMYSGSENGYIYKFGNIDGNLSGTFSIDSTFHSIWEGTNSIVALADITNDNKLDMLVGNTAGGIAYYDGSLTVSINEKVETIYEINLYPNPTSGVFTINLGDNNLKNAQLKVVDLLGKVLLNHKVSQQNQILNLSNFAKGIYLVQFTNEFGAKVYKVVKE